MGRRMRCDKINRATKKRQKLSGVTAQDLVLSDKHGGGLVSETLGTDSGSHRAQGREMGGERIQTWSEFSDKHLSSYGCFSHETTRHKHT